MPVGFAFTVLYFWAARPRIWSLAVGAVIAAAGLVVRAVASGHVTKNEALTMSGPYAYVRNPLYLGSTIIATGFAVAARSLWIAIAMIVIFIIIYLPVIRSEEAFLKSKFPEFDDYVQHVPRLLPRSARYGAAGSFFSWDLYRKHREYNAVIGAVLMISVLVAKMIWLTK